MGALSARVTILVNYCALKSKNNKQKCGWNSNNWEGITQQDYYFKTALRNHHKTWAETTNYAVYNLPVCHLPYLIHKVSALGVKPLVACRNIILTNKGTVIKRKCIRSTGDATLRSSIIFRRIL